MFVLALLLSFSGLAGCSFPIRNEGIEAGKPKYNWLGLPQEQTSDTLVVVTASGGGTRAAALAMAVLQTMSDITLPSGKRLADEIDIISSVSGGSVTAGYFALHGAEGLKTLETDFIRKDGMALLAG